MSDEELRRALFEESGRQSDREVVSGGVRTSRNSSLFKRNNKILKAVIGGAALVGLTSVVATSCSPTQPIAVVSNQETDLDAADQMDEAQQEDPSLVSDRFSERVSEIGFHNNMKTIEQLQAELLEALGGDAYQGEVVTHTSEDGTETQWTSEEDLAKAEEAGLVDAPVGTEKTEIPTDSYVDNNGETVHSDVFVDPNGEVWASKEEYEEFVAGQNQGEVVIEQGEGWRDPETGDVWKSKEEYDAYKASNNGQTVTPVSEEQSDEMLGIQKDELGGYVNEEGYYIVGNEAYGSKDEYLELSKNEGTVIPVDENQVVSGENENQTSLYATDELGGYYNEDGFYIINGAGYPSKEEYLSIKEAETHGGNQDQFTGEETGFDGSETYSSGDQTYATDELGGYYNEEGFYIINGAGYPSKEDYLSIENAETYGGDQDQFTGEETGFDGVVTYSGGDQTYETDDLGGYVNEDGLYVINGAAYENREAYLSIENAETYGGDEYQFTGEETGLDGSETYSGGDQTYETDDLGGYVNEDGLYVINGAAYENREAYLSIQNAETYGGDQDQFTGEETGLDGSETYSGGDQTYETDELGGYVNEEGIYFINNEAYTSKDDYLATLNDNPSPTSVETTDNASVVAEIVYDELGGYVSDGYYIVEDGAYPSKLDYLEMEEKLDDLGGYMGNDNHYYVIKGEQNGKYDSKDAYMQIIGLVKEAETPENNPEETAEITSTSLTEEDQPAAEASDGLTEENSPEETLDNPMEDGPQMTR